MSNTNFQGQNSLLYTWQKIKTLLGNKVDKVSGKALSTNDFTDALKGKLDGIAAEANKTIVDSSLSGSSTNPVQNKVVKNALDGKAPTSHSHAIADVTGLQGALDDKADDGHTHAIATTSAPGFMSAEQVSSLASHGNSIETIQEDIEDINASLDAKANTGTTLASYGILNAYTKAETDSRISSAVASAGHLNRTIVESLPAVASADPDTIYMVLSDATSSDNKYIEWMLIDGAFEKTGDTTVDLSGYVLKSSLVELTNAQIDAIFAQ